MLRTPESGVDFLVSIFQVIILDLYEILPRENWRLGRSQSSFPVWLELCSLNKALFIRTNIFKASNFFSPHNHICYKLKCRFDNCVMNWRTLAKKLSPLGSWDIFSIHIDLWTRRVYLVMYRHNCDRSGFSGIALWAWKPKATVAHDKRVSKVYK